MLRIQHRSRCSKCQGVPAKRYTRVNGGHIRLCSDCASAILTPPTGDVTYLQYLPAELLLIIRSYLLYIDRVFLSLSCRALHEIIWCPSYKADACWVECSFCKRAQNCRYSMRRGGWYCLDYMTGFRVCKECKALFSFRERNKRDSYGCTSIDRFLIRHSSREGITRAILDTLCDTCMVLLICQPSLQVEEEC